VVNKPSGAASRYAPLSAVAGEDGGRGGDRDKASSRPEPRRAGSEHLPAADTPAASAALARAASYQERAVAPVSAVPAAPAPVRDVSEGQRVESILATLDSGSDGTVSMLSQRLTNLRLLRNYWERGEVLSIVDHLHTILSTCSSDSQVIVVADFFSSVDLKSPLISLDVCGQLLPLLEAMLDTGNSSLISATLRAVQSLCESFGDLIRQTRAVVVPGGVDLSREERLQKCNVSFVTFARIKSKLDGVRYQHRKNLAMRDTVDKVQNLLVDTMM
jgi:hypothetical protein